MLEEEPTFQRRTAHGDVPPYADAEARKQLYRDTQRKVLGGVAAGVAHYFRTDPLWVRILLLLLLFTDAFITFGALSSITLISYVVLWIVLPGREDLSTDEKVKKLFRNPDDQVVGGVCSGVAAYFGLDATLIRLLFVASIFFGGVGVIAYIVLWIITPQALTLTDKMRMKGEPVTLSNIESSIKKNFRVNEGGEESTLLKAVLFPFRLFSAFFVGLGKIIGPLAVFLGEAARVLVGLLLVLVGGALLLATLGLAGAALGLATSDYTYSLVWNDIPWEVVQANVPGSGLVFALVVTFVPALGLVLAGIAVIARRHVVSPAVGWSALGVWLIALAGLSVTLVPVATDFRQRASYTDTKTILMNESTPALTLAGQSSYEDPSVRLTLAGHADSTYRLRQRFEARGRNHQRALDNARAITYELQQQDSTLRFPAEYTLSDMSRFRMQEVDLTLYLPYNQSFVIDRDLKDILRRSVLYRAGLSIRDLQDNTFMFTAEGLQCITCEQRENMDDQFPNDNTP